MASQERAAAAPTASLRQQALAVLCEGEPARKAQLALALSLQAPVQAQAQLTAPPGQVIPQRPLRPRMVAHTQLQQRPLTTRAGHGALLHALAHIEFNAIDLAADVCWRFAGLPDDFYRDWARVMQEEALHFSLLRTHLQSLGFDYGDFDAHNALWEMAERTGHDVLARVALVPRTMEARGLDASPAVRNKLVSIQDTAGAAILDTILRDEIGHVAVGNRWFAWLCAERGLEPLATYAELTRRYQAPRLRGPFNLAARRAAGFSEGELLVLQQGAV